MTTKKELKKKLKKQQKLLEAYRKAQWCEHEARRLEQSHHPLSPTAAPLPVFWQGTWC